jgi:hypothetical protein
MREKDLPIGRGGALMEPRGRMEPGGNYRNIGT